MTRRYTSAAIALLIGTASLPLGAQSPANAMTVFVTVAPLKVSDQTQAQRQAGFADAAKKRKDLEQTLNTQYGKKRESWPSHEQELYRDAEEAAALANVNLLCGQVDHDELAGSIEDTKKGLTGAGLRGRREHVVLVESAADAQLIVELKCRRETRGSGGLFGGHHFVLFSISRGPRLSADRFAAIPASDRQDGLLARPGLHGQGWMFEAVGAGSWKVAGSVVSSMVDAFALSHHDALVGSEDTKRR